MVQFINITASIVTVATIIFVIQIIFKWLNAPKFIVGVLPTPKERQRKGIDKLGEFSPFDELHFNRKILAKNIGKEEKVSCLGTDTDSVRNIHSHNNIIDLPVLIQNIGRSEAGRYKLVITFSNPDIRIVNVASETLEIDGLYVQDSSLFQVKSALSKIPTPEIRKIYESLGLTRDYVSFIGSLASFTFELVFLKLLVPQNCDTFSTIFRINSPDFFFYNRQVYGQHINILKN